MHSNVTIENVSWLTLAGPPCTAVPNTWQTFILIKTVVRGYITMNI